MRSWKTVIIISTLLAVLIAWASPASHRAQGVVGWIAHDN